MFENVIQQIFDAAYLDNEIKGIHPLSQKDWQEEYNKLEKFESNHQFSNKDCAYLECDIINAVSYKSELKGFTNGFKFAVRLLSEANRT